MIAAAIATDMLWLCNSKPSARVMVLSCQAGEKAVSCGVTNADSIDELSDIKDLHLRSRNGLSFSSFQVQ